MTRIGIALLVLALLAACNPSYPRPYPRALPPADSPQVEAASSLPLVGQVVCRQHSAFVTGYSHDPYATNGAGSFLPQAVALSATFNMPMVGAGNGNFVVRGSQTGFGPSVGYSGAGTSTLTSPPRTFRAGEEVEVSLTSGLWPVQPPPRPSPFPPHTLWNLCPPQVLKYRVQTRPQGRNGFTYDGPLIVGNGPGSVTMGDFNGDGWLDLVSANYFSDNLTVLLRVGNGRFSGALGSPVAAGDGPESVVTGDFNNDGRLDLVTANALSSDVTVLLGNGAGGFSPAPGSPVAAGAGATSVAVGDLNTDGRLDLVTANSSANNLAVLLGNGAGGFSPAQGSPVAVGLFPRSVAVGDVNNDGRLDLVSGNNDSDNVTVLLGSGNGRFSPAPGSPVAVGDGPEVAMGDFNNDGRLDLATANAYSNNLTVLLGNGSGGFSVAPGSPVAAGFDPRSVVVGDFDGNGRLDLVTASPFENSLTVLFGNGAGGFSSSTRVSAGTYRTPLSVAVGDLNGDGKLDLVSANTFNDNLTVLLKN